jgi:hypothetical protein
MLLTRERSLMVELARLMVRRAGTPKHTRPANFDYGAIGIFLEGIPGRDSPGG